MKRLIAITASILVNAGALGVIAVGINQSETPHGSVYVTQLPEQTQLPLYAQADELAKAHRNAPL